jgi:DNA-directed RNA polymerase I subunit RPA1
MDLSYSSLRTIDITCIPKAISFFFYSTREIKDISSVEIYCPVFFDSNGKIIQGGLFDQRMGSFDKKKFCKFCLAHYSSCPGHPGFIDLALPVLNPLLKILFKTVLAAKCWYCNFFKISNWKLNLFFLKLLIFDFGIKIRRKKFELLIKKFFSNNNLDFKKAHKYYYYQIEYTKKVSSFSQQIFILKESDVNLQKNIYKMRGKFWKDLTIEFLKTCRNQKFCKKCQRNKITYFNFNGLLDSARNFRKSKTKKFFFSIRKHEKTFAMSKNFQKKNTSYFFGRNINKNTSSFQLKQQIELLWKTEKDFCKLTWGSLGNSNRFTKEEFFYIFFLDFILVPPSRFRPVFNSDNKIPNDASASNPQNFFLMRILKTNQQIYLAFGSTDNFLLKNWGGKFYLELEKEVSFFFDNSSMPSTKKLNPLGIRQQLEKKNGLFRMHLMGKRSFHTARSIIVPDPYLSGEEVGLPYIFSQELRISQIINQINFNKKIFFTHLKNYKNKKNSYLQLENLSGFNFNILSKQKNIIKTQILNICFKYFLNNIYQKDEEYGSNYYLRKIQNKDLLILNRQPTLHRASIMGHKVKILPGIKCIKLNYANCNSYNADFDGDEMNIHVPTNILAISESLVLAIASNNYKIPTNNSPIRGMIQDHIISAIELSKKDSFFNSKNFFHLLSQVSDEKNFNNFFMIPTIIKPKFLWTGKQLFSSAMYKISKNFHKFFLESRTKLIEQAIGRDETKILIRRGELIRGIIDSSQLGKTKYGILHAIYEKFGYRTGEKFLYNFSTILNEYQRLRAHTTGLNDFISKNFIEQQRIRTLKKKEKFFKYFSRKLISKHGIFSINKSSFIENYKDYVSLTSLFIISGYLINYFISTQKNFLNEIQSKNIEICIPGGLEKDIFENGFSKMTISGAKGSSLNIFQICLQLGQIELEGKCIPRGKSAKTLPCFDPFDLSPSGNGFVFQRFLTGLSPPEYFFHCMAGREGLLDTAIKTSQSGYIQRSLVKHLESVKISYDLLVRFSTNQVIQFNYSEDGLNFNNNDFNKNLSWQIQNSSIRENKVQNRLSLFLKNSNAGFLENKNPYNANDDKFQKIISKIPYHTFSDVLNLSKKFRKIQKNIFKKKNNFIQEELTIENFLKNQVQPGESVGIIVSQSIGEPCTQMTLNNFHFAGKIASVMNQGIPRLKEIILLASKYPKTPTISAKLNKNLPKKKLIFVEKRLKKIFIFDLIESLSIYSKKSKNFSKIVIYLKISSKHRFKHQFALKKSLIFEKASYFLQKIKIEFAKKFSKIKNSFFYKFFINNKNSRYTNKNFSNTFLSKSIMNKKNLTKKRGKKILELNGYFLKNIESQINEKNFFDLNFNLKKISKLSHVFIDHRQKTLHSQGVNFLAFWKYPDIINFKKIASNDFYATMITYGIEAGRSVLFNELKNLFKLQSINITYHHLNLIADYMTRMGIFRGFNRNGLLEENAMQKITYETALNFLIESSINGMIDGLSTISSSLIFAKPCKIGTGIVGLSWRFE